MREIKFRVWDKENKEIKFDFIGFSADGRHNEVYLDREQIASDCVVTMDEQVKMKDKAKHIRDGLLAAFCNAGGYVKKEGLNTEQLGNLQEAINFLAEIYGRRKNEK